MKSYAKASKSLLIFDLDGTLCHMTKSFKRTANVSGIYSQGDLEAKPIFAEKTTAIYARP